MSIRFFQPALRCSRFLFRLCCRLFRSLGLLLFRHRRALLIALFCSLALALIWYLIATRGYEKATGTYIAGGGSYFVRIGKGSLYGTVQVTNGIILDEFLKYIGEHDFHPDDTEDRAYWEDTYKHSAYVRNQHLFIQQSASQKWSGIAEDFNEFSWGTSGSRYRLWLELAPSEASPGDWDLIDAKMESTMGIEHDLSWYNFTKLFAARSWHSAYVQCVGLFGWNQTTKFGLDPAKAPLKSFLHRLDDDRITPYFRDRLYGRSSRRLSMIRELAGLHPKDLYLVPHQIELEARSGDLAQAAALMKRWEPAINKSPDILLRQNLKVARRWLDFAKSRLEHPDLSPLAALLSSENVKPQPVDANSMLAAMQGGDNGIVPTRMDLEAQRQWMLQSYDLGLIPIRPSSLVKPCFYNDLPDSPGSEPPGESSLRIDELYNRIGQFYTLAMFDLFADKRLDLPKLLGSCYMMGQRFQDVPQGLWMRQAAIRGLTTLALNACESPTERQALRAVLDRLHSLPVDPTYQFGVSPSSLLPFMHISEEMEKDIQDWRVEIGQLKSRIELLRLALAAGDFLLKTGDYPTSIAQLAPIIGDGIPADPFLRPAPLSFKTVGDDVLIYSCGPDQLDSHGALEYDSTNGTTSAGDLILRVPRNRQYPFPAGPVRAATAAGLFRQFPNGLPPDALDYFENPLKAMESSGTLPVTILSTHYAGIYDSKRNHAAGRPIYGIPKTPYPKPNAWNLAPPYDPTNGAYSLGDLYLELPK